MTLSGIEGSQWNLFEYVDSMPLIAADPSGNVRSIGGAGCQDACEAAAQNPTLRDSGGTVVCKCNFISTPSVCKWFCEKCACIFEHPDIPIGDCPEWEKCGLEHEEGHFPDVTCDPTDRKPGEGWFPAPAVDPSKVKTYECRAKKKEIKCLKNALAKSSSSCQTRMKYYISEQQRWVDRNCGWSR